MNDERAGRPVPVPLTWVDSAQVYVPNMDSLEQDAAIRGLRISVQKLPGEIQCLRKDLNEYKHKKSTIDPGFIPMCKLKQDHKGPCELE